jgi:large subunit ribosomal protein L9
MKVILKEDVDNLGAMGEVVRVKDGYARNFLIPKGTAVVANERNVKALEHERRIIEVRKKKLRSAVEQLAEKVSSVEISFTRKAGEEGKLFGSITSMDIAEALAEKGIDVEKKKISIPEPIKRVGEHSVDVSLGLEVTAQVSVKVAAEEE